MKLTEKLGLKKPSLNDYVNVSDLNDNMDILDEEVGSMGDDLESHKADDTHIPKGLISMWSGLIAAIPAGWTLCNGENGTPNLTDRFIVGAGGDYSVGDTGGLDSVTLTTSQLPSHSHSSGTLSTSSNGDHSHSGSSASAGSHSHGSGTLSTNSTGSHSHTGSTNTTGSHSHTYSTPYSTGDSLDIGSHIGESSRSTSSAGSHSHTVSINSAGSHSHTVSGSTASADSHSHTITIGTEGSHSHTVSGYTGYNGSDGGSHENRPPYFALAFIMKL